MINFAIWWPFRFWQPSCFQISVICLWYQPTYNSIIFVHFYVNHIYSNKTYCWTPLYHLSIVLCVLYVRRTHWSNRYIILCSETIRKMYYFLCHHSVQIPKCFIVLFVKIWIQVIFRRLLHSKRRLYISRCLCVILCRHLNRFGQMNPVSKPFNYL